MAAQQRREFVGDGVYLDYTGAAQIPRSLVHAHTQLILDDNWGNPHSAHGASMETGERIETVRRDILKRCHAGDDYEVVFTPNATGALRLIASEYPWDAKTSLTLGRSNHNSVNGLRSPARQAGAEVAYWKTDDDLRLHGDDLESLLKRQRDRFNQLLVAFPAQSNLSGVQHRPEEFVGLAKSYDATVILDTAAYAPTHPIDLETLQFPDAIVLSFYKMFGYPTGIGALIIRRKLLDLLKQSVFSGGAVKIVHPDSGHLAADGHARHEYGTVNFQGIPAVSLGFNFLDSLGGVKNIGNHVQRITEQAFSRLQTIEGVQIYGPSDMTDRGGTIAFNLVGPDGKLVPSHELVQKATQEKIYMRNGCHCNPGDAIRALNIDPLTIYDLIERQANGHSMELDDIVQGITRVSFGYGTCGEHVRTFLDFMEEQSRRICK